MAFRRIVVRVDESQRATSSLVILEGVRYGFAFRWSAAASRWLLDLSDASGVALVRGIVLVVGHDLLEPHRTLAVPPGRLFVFDSSRADEDPRLDDLDGRCWVLYEESSA